MTHHQPRERILVVDDDRAFRIAARALLEDERFVVTVASSGAEALTCLAGEPYDLVISDLVMADMNGLDLLPRIAAHDAGLPVIMVTGFGSIATAVEAMRLGAVDYLTKPANNEELVLKVERALDVQRTRRELRLLREELRATHTWANMVSRSPQMQQVIQSIRRVADTDVTVLVRGESGTGKELVARALHFHSVRRERPFVAVNCSAIPETLLESELFGHEKGAFTGAAAQRRGKFEEASGGTLFLDEIGDLTPQVQTKLLRVLQEKTIERVGGDGPLAVDVRVIAATHRDLERLVHEGGFRGDLFYRLNVFPILLPPLRERLEDIPLLAEHLLERHAGLSGGRVKAIAPEVLQAMLRCPWPGNIREMENLIKRAIINTTGDTIVAIDLPEGASAMAATLAPLPTDLEPPPFKEYLAAIVRDAEERYLRRILRQSHGNIHQAAKVMGLDRKTVYRKMTEFGMHPEEFRA